MNIAHPEHPPSGQFSTPGSKKARYTISWVLPSNRSVNDCSPSGPTNR